MDLQFNYTSAKKAYILPVTGLTRGAIPKWVKGTLYRNGSGKFEVESYKYKHAFDGLAMIQRYYINNGEVTFNSQYIQSKTYLKNMAADRIVVSEFGTASYPDPCRSIFDRLSIKFDSEMTDNTTICVYPVGDELFTATETHAIHRIDPVDLSTIGTVRLPNILSIHRATAHNHIDIETGEVHLLGFQNTPSPAYALVTLPPIHKKDSSNISEKYGMEKLLTGAKLIGKINSRWKMNPSYMHSFGITENYYIFFECPLVVNILDVLKSMIKLNALSDALKWWPRENALIHIMERKTGKVISNTYCTDAFFTFHHINAYEEDDHVVIDYGSYDDPSIITDLRLDQPEKDVVLSFCSPRRLVVPLKVDETNFKSENLVKLKGTACTAKVIQGNQNNTFVIHCKPEELCVGISMELHTINYNVNNGKKYRFTYGVARNSLIKIDVVSKTSLTWVDGDEKSYVCESIYVKNPHADDNNPEDEDFGVLLCPILVKDENVETGRFQSLVFIDAKSMTELGRAEFPSVSIPFPLHGIFQNSD